MLYGILVTIRSEEDTAYVTQRAAMLVAELKDATLDIFAVGAPSCARRALSWMRGPKQHSERAEQERKMRRLSCQSEYLRQHYGVRCTIASGAVALATQVAARPETTAAGMVVLGRNGPEWAKLQPEASEVARIAVMSACPVLVVRNEPRAAYSRIAVPVDFSDIALRVTETVMWLLPEAHITFLHSYRVAGQGTMLSLGMSDQAIDNCRLQAQRQAQGAFSAFLERLGRPLMKFSLVLTAQSEEVTARAYIHTIKPDLIVLANGSTTQMSQWLADSTASTVLRDTDCDVLLLQSAQAARSPSAGDGPVLPPAHREQSTVSGAS